MGWSYEPIEMEDYFSGSPISLEQMQQEIESLEKKVSHCTEERKEYLFKIFKTHLEYLCTY